MRECVLLTTSVEPAGSIWLVADKSWSISNDAIGIFFLLMENASIVHRDASFHGSC